MKKNLCLILLLMLQASIVTFAQENEEDSKPSFDVTADIVSRYVWRGILLNESPAIQPTLSFTAGNFTIGSWGSYTFSREEFQEVDLFATYTIGSFDLTLYDYYNPIDTLGWEGDYFKFKNTNTRHTFEGTITYNGPESFPIVLNGSVMFYGNDKNDNNKNVYSTYIELSYPFKTNEIDVNPFIGITPANGYYADKFDVVNLGISASKSIQISDKYQMPIKALFAVNPAYNKVFLVLSVTL